MSQSDHSWTFRRRLVLALVLIGFGASGHWVLARERNGGRLELGAELPRPLAAFPTQIGSWLGTDWLADPAMIADIKVDDHLQRLYVHPSGAKVIVWLSFSRRSADRYHYPTVCMRGTGWSEDLAARRLLPASNQAPAMLVFDFERDAERQTIVYWYYLFGTDAFDRWLRTGSRWARGFLRGETGGGLTVEIFSQGESADRTRLAEFAGQVARELEGWLPDGTASDCALGAAY